MNDEEETCEHEWHTTCDGVEHVDECLDCGLTVTSPCPDAGTWQEEEE